MSDEVVVVEICCSIEFVFEFVLGDVAFFEEVFVLVGEDGTDSF